MMYRAFEIQDVLSGILDHFSIHNSDCKLKDLVALTRTCRTFKEPALDRVIVTVTLGLRRTVCSIHAQPRRSVVNLE